MQRKLYQHIASRLQAVANCERSGNDEWRRKHQASINWLVNEFMPSGSGLDCGTKLDETSTPQKLVFNVEFHHMNGGGMYDGWSEHQIIVTADLASDIDLRVTGRNRNDIKDYLGETYHFALTRDVDDESASLAAVVEEA